MCNLNGVDLVISSASGNVHRNSRQERVSQFKVREQKGSDRRKYCWKPLYRIDHRLSCRENLDRKLFIFKSFIEKLLRYHKVSWFKVCNSMVLIN